MCRACAFFLVEWTVTGISSRSRPRSCRCALSAYAVPAITCLPLMIYAAGPATVRVVAICGRSSVKQPLRCPPRGLGLRDAQPRPQGGQGSPLASVRSQGRKGSSASTAAASSFSDGVTEPTRPPPWTHRCQLTLRMVRSTLGRARAALASKACASRQSSGLGPFHGRSFWGPDSRATVPQGAQSTASLGHCCFLSTCSLSTGRLPVGQSVTISSAASQTVNILPLPDYRGCTGSSPKVTLSSRRGKGFVNLLPTFTLYFLFFSRSYFNLKDRGREQAGEGQRERERILRGGSIP